MTPTPRHDTAVCATVHAGVLPFLEPWLASLRTQTDQAFDLCVAVDGVAPTDLPDLPDEGRLVHVVRPAAGSTPVEVRNALFGEATAAWELIVAVDADDVLGPRRVGAAKDPGDDLCACVLELVDRDGAALGRRFCEVGDDTPEGLGRLLPRANVFGLSNTVWRAGLLRECLPVPAGVLAADWYLATAAWLRGAALRLDRRPLMSYRQYGANIARVVPPFAPAVVRAATAVVLAHQCAVAGRLAAGAGGEAAALAAARRATERFAAAVVADEEALAAYCAALDRLPPPQAWWTIVADPALEDMWST